MNIPNALSTYVIPVFGIVIAVFAHKKIYYHFKLLQLKDERLEDLSYLEIFMDFRLLFDYFYIIFPFYVRIELNHESELAIKIIRSVYGFWIGFALIILTSAVIS